MPGGREREKERKSHLAQVSLLLAKEQDRLLNEKNYFVFRGAMD